MDVNRYTGRSGWASQWDRHRWPVGKGSAPSKANCADAEHIDSPGHRLWSLDEFEPLPWHVQPKSTRFGERLVFTPGEIGLTLLIGVLVGLGYALYS
jgi:hypothetical protein